MFDLRFNPASVSNEVGLIPPPPGADFREGRVPAMAHWTSDAEAAEAMQWDHASAGPRPGRIETGEEWTLRAHAGELRAEDYSGHCVVPATDDYQSTVHLTTFVNHRSPLPGATGAAAGILKTSASRPAAASSPQQSGKAGGSRHPERAMNKQQARASEAEAKRAAAALKAAPSLGSAAPQPKAQGRSWAAAVAKTAPMMSSEPAPGPKKEEAAPKTMSAGPSAATPAAKSTASTPAQKPAAASKPTPTGTPFHAPMPAPDLSAASTAGGKISWAAMFAGDTPLGATAPTTSPPVGGVAAAPLADVPPLAQISPEDEPAAAEVSAGKASAPKPDAAPPAKKPETAKPSAPLSFAAALKASSPKSHPPAVAKSEVAAASKEPTSDVAGAAPTRERDGVVAPQAWQQEQRRLATSAVFDDSSLGFAVPWDEKPLAPAPALPGLEAGAAATSPATSPPLPDERPPNALRYVGGLDISFVKDTKIAVASLVILEFPSMKELHTVMDHCVMDVPYIPGYLAFREVDPLRAVIAQARAKWPEHFPQLFFVDGNGLLHYRSCGLATHLGVVIDAPTIGCAKNLLNVDGLSKDDIQAKACAQAESVGPKAPVSSRAVPLVGRSGKTWGYAALTGNSKTNPIFISPGHRVSPHTAMRLALLMAPYRVVEPIRQADLRSREYVKQNFGK